MFSDNIITPVMELNAIKIAVARSLVATGGSDVQLLSVFNSLDALHTSYKPQLKQPLMLYELLNLHMNHDDSWD